MNPEYYTVWNLRRRCLLAGFLSSPPEANSEQTSPEAGEKDDEILRSELDFTVPLLMGHPKCYWIWEYRHWLLEQAIERLTVLAARRMWEDELALITTMLSRDQRNFHAWSYRRFVVTKLESNQLDGSSLAESELDYTKKMITLNLSNFSAWHSRSNLSPRILQERGADDEARAAFLSAELDYAREGLNVGPDDQSLWYYHNFLISQIVDVGNKQTIAPALTVEERVKTLKHELLEIEDLLDDYKDDKCIYEGLVEYTLDLIRLQPDEGAEMASRLQDWLRKLQALDPMRKGRWDDIQQAISANTLQKV